MTLGGDHEVSEKAYIYSRAVARFRMGCASLRQPRLKGGNRIDNQDLGLQAY